MDAGIKRAVTARQSLAHHFAQMQMAGGNKGGRVLEQARRLGTFEGELLDNFPTLRAEDIVHAWAYVRAHRDEIEQQIHDNEEI